MRTNGQLLSVLAFALGVGMLVAGDIAEPKLEQIQIPQHSVEDYRNLAIVLKGFGAGILTLGILGLIVPWANAWVYGRPVPPPSANSIDG